MRFDKFDSKLNHLIRASEKLPMPNQPKTSSHIGTGFMVRGSDCPKWLMYKLGQHEEFESKEPKQLRHSPRCDQE